ncbi:sigma-70 family RNA polymerase sigma factor [Sphingomonas sp. RHCKR7]|uniref:RNA polymerase sigma factor n=1 Tax=Sphingomonas folli TaxID=2862497 RepID=UPI001C66A269|nr:sigma-70 family RNA polymerase sigma factor [Sphingomonas folli]MBW6527278.1 sigma-70 family RNA polymerase sigma factor [Sphingomonas folli]
MGSTTGWRDDAAACPAIESARALDVADAALHRALRAFVGGRVAQSADRDDVVQETYARLLGYQAGRRVDDVKALCFAIARNLLLDHHRAARHGATVELDEALACPLPSAERVVAFRRAVAVLAGALERMPPLRREIFLRKRLDGLTTAEIAGALEMSLAAVEKHVVRALADLRGALARRGVTLADGA